MAYAENIFTAMIDETGTIWEAGTGRKRQSVGIDAQREQEYQRQISEMQEVIDNYYGKLIELGAIVPPKTPEQIAQEAAAQQSEINQKLLEAISGLQSEIGELRKNGNAGNGNEPSKQKPASVSKSVGEVPRASTKRSTASAKTTPRNSK